MNRLFISVWLCAFSLFGQATRTVVVGTDTTGGSNQVVYPSIPIAFPTNVIVKGSVYLPYDPNGVLSYLWFLGTNANANFDIHNIGNGLYFQHGGGTPFVIFTNGLSMFEGLNPSSANATTNFVFGVKPSNLSTTFALAVDTNGIVYGNGAGLTNAVGTNFLIASQWATLNSDVNIGGGTDATTGLSNALRQIGTHGGGTLMLNGAALISAPLQVYSNTTIWCPNPSCGVYLANGANCYMLRNASFTTNGNPIIIPTVFDANISILGGTWTGNQSNQTKYVNNGATTNAWVHGMFFCGVSNLLVKDVTIQDSRSFALFIAYGANPHIYNYTAKWAAYKTADNNDAIHFWGPISGSVIGQNISAFNAPDDVIALNYCESVDNGASFTGQFATNTLIRGVHAENVQSVLRINGSQGSVGNITVSDVWASMNAAGPTSALIYDNGGDSLDCDNWNIYYPTNSSGTYQNIQLFSNIPHAVYRFRDFKVIGGTNMTNFVESGNAAGTGQGHTVIFDNVNVSKPPGVSRGNFFAFANQLANNGWNSIKFQNMGISGFTNLFYNASASANITNLFIENVNLNGATTTNGNVPLNVYENVTLSNGVSTANIASGIAFQFIGNMAGGTNYPVVSGENVTITQTTTGTVVTAGQTGVSPITASNITDNGTPGGMLVQNRITVSHTNLLTHSVVGPTYVGTYATPAIDGTGRYLFVPIWVPKMNTFTNCFLPINNMTVTGAVKIAIFNVSPTNGLPGTLIANLATNNITANTVLTNTISLTLNRGVYWIGTCFLTGTACNSVAAGTDFVGLGFGYSTIASASLLNGLGGSTAATAGLRIVSPSGGYPSFPPSTLEGTAIGNGAGFDTGNASPAVFFR